MEKNGVTCSRCGKGFLTGTQVIYHFANDRLTLCSDCLDSTIYAWPRLNYFSQDSEIDSWGNASYMDAKLLFLLDVARETVGEPFIIHKNGGYAESGHSPTGFHPLGQAVDGHFEGIHYLDAKDLTYWWPGGLGLYPDWNNPGFHFDVGLYRRW